MDTIRSQGAVPGDPQNTADPKGLHTRSSFTEKDLGYPFFATLPFGEIRPFTFFETVPADRNIQANFISNVQSYTLKAPLMQPIHMKKLIAQVPRECLLPLNWDKWFKNPVIGQDIPGDVGTSVLGFWHQVYTAMTYQQGLLPNSTTISTANEASDYFTKWFRFLLMCEMFYSDGNLLKHCSISGRPWFYSVQSDGHTLNTIDQLFDTFVEKFVDEVVSTMSAPNFVLSFGGTDIYTVEPSIDPNRNYPGRWINMREALALMRDNLNFTLQFAGVSSADLAVMDQFRQDINNDVPFASIIFADDNPTDPADAVAIDLKRLWAYQLTVAHFCTNDSVDFLFTAELYRQYIGDLVTRTASGTFDYVAKFSVNGVTYLYDYLSANNFTRIMSVLAGATGTTIPTIAGAYAYLSALFSFKRSLRYLDYFTGSKTRPLAVGDVNVQVNSNLVNVVDTQAKTFLARFLNVINRSGMRNYVKNVFGVDQDTDWHNPQYLVALDDVVTGERIENTGNQQWDKDYPNSVTSLLHGNSDRYAFKMDFDRSSILIGLVWFDIDRVYSQATERQNLHYDRFDEFQPYMQYTGDQSLMRVELGTPLASGSGLLATDPFGYKLRNCEYKERYPQCAGGFCNDMLDGYLFKADVLEAGAVQNVSPSFIRSFPSELDRFYLSLTGYSLATYFHFIVKFQNNFSGSRPMAYAPTLM